MFGRASPRTERVAVTGRTVRQIATATSDHPEPPGKPKRIPFTERTRSARQRRQHEEQERRPKPKLSFGALLKSMGRKGDGESISRDKESKSRAGPPTTTLERSRLTNSRGGRLLEREFPLREDSHRRGQGVPDGRKPHVGAVIAAQKASQKPTGGGHDRTDASPVRHKGSERPSLRQQLTTNPFARRNPKHHETKEHHEQKETQPTETPAKVVPMKSESHASSRGSETIRPKGKFREEL